MRCVIAAIVLVVVIAVIAVHLRSGKSGGSGDSSPASPRPLLRQFGALRPEHFEKCPVWVNCHVIDYDEPWYDDTDEETFRPWRKGLPVDPAETMFLVRATLTLADGTEMSGFITPRHRPDSGGRPELGVTQPQVFLPDGRPFGFWFGVLTPPQEEIARFYAGLGKSQQEVFPIAFEADDGLATGVGSGSIPGFCSSGGGDEIRVVR